MFISDMIIASPNGIAMIPTNIPIKIRKGARIKSGLSAVDGIMSSSLKNKCRPSATGCNKPTSQHENRNLAPLVQFYPE